MNCDAYKLEQWLMVGFLAILPAAGFAADLVANPGDAVEAEAPVVVTTTSYCKVIKRNGEVIKRAIEINREPHGPNGDGHVKIAGLMIHFESGWGGVTEETGGQDKYVYQIFSVFRGNTLVGKKDLGESGQVFDLKLNRNPRIAKIHCHL